MHSHRCESQRISHVIHFVSNCFEYISFYSSDNSAHHSVISLSIPLSLRFTHRWLLLCVCVCVFCAFFRVKCKIISVAFHWSQLLFCQWMESQLCIWLNSKITTHKCQTKTDFPRTNKRSNKKDQKRWRHLKIYQSAG